MSAAFSADLKAASLKCQFSAQGGDVFGILKRFNDGLWAGVEIFPGGGHNPAAFLRTSLIRDCQPGPVLRK